MIAKHQIASEIIHIKTEARETVKDSLGTWVSVYDSLPPENVPTLTRIDDGRGIRNESVLKRINQLWFVPDGIMYVYYVPTHWFLPSAPERSK